MVTPSRGLVEVLRQLNQADGTLSQRWESVLDSAYGTVDFVLRHTAVVDMFHSTARAVMAQPDSAASRIRLDQVYSWWSAVIGPDAQWRSGGQPFPIDQHTLAYMELTAEQLDNINDATPASEDALSELLTQAHEWRSLIQGEPGLPAGLRATLTQHLETLIWSIANADLFGPGIVVPAADRLTGSIVRASIRPGRSMTWREKVLALVMAVSAITTNVDKTLTAIEHGSGVIAELLPGEDAAGESGSEVAEQ